MDNLILTNEANGILTITLNRLEKKNALTSAMYLQLCDAFEHASSNTAIRCLVIQGDENCFCAGNDLADFLNTKQNEELAAFKFIKTLANFDKPIVVAVAGAAVGIGTTLLLHADIVVAANNAKFALPFNKLGLCPEAASSYLLPQMLGHVKAFELLVLGETFSADTALRLQLINHVCSSEELIPLAQVYANKITTLPSEAVLASRALLKQTNLTLINQVMEQEVDKFSELMQTQACKSILASFLAK